MIFLSQKALDRLAADVERVNELAEDKMSARIDSTKISRLIQNDPSEWQSVNTGPTRNYPYYNRRHPQNKELRQAITYLRLLEFKCSERGDKAGEKAIRAAIDQIIEVYRK